METIVIIGASLAGVRAAETLRTNGFAGALTIIGAEAHMPYDRPPLSKNFLAGDWDADRIALRKADDLYSLNINMKAPRVEPGRGVKYHSVIELPSAASADENTNDNTTTSKSSSAVVHSPLFTDAESGMIRVPQRMAGDGDDEQLQHLRASTSVSPEPPRAGQTDHVFEEGAQTSPTTHVYYFRYIIGGLMGGVFFIILLRVLGGKTRIVIVTEGSPPNISAPPTSNAVQKMILEYGSLAFGSCTSYDLRDWDIFTDAILPSKPDAWVWAGDMVYLDDTDLDCTHMAGGSDEWKASCNCTATWLHSPPFSCHAGDTG